MTLGALIHTRARQYLAQGISRKETVRLLVKEYYIQKEIIESIVVQEWLKMFDGH